MLLDRRLTVRVGDDLSFLARLERERAPRTCEAFESLLPMTRKLLQARWSGEAGWIPFGDQFLGVPYENQTCHPAPGQILLYPGGISEGEILVPFGATCFSSRVGQLIGSHFLTIVEGLDRMALIGQRLWWNGAQDISIAFD